MHYFKEITISCSFGQSEAPKALLFDESTVRNAYLSGNKVQRVWKLETTC
jgi:hypothetical protein